MQKITADIMALCNLPEDDFKKFISWVWELRSKNALDMKVLTYPRVCMARASNEDGTIMLLPFQPVLMYESLAPKPELTERQKALSLWRISEVVDRAMKDTGMCESFFITTDEQESKTCANHGWTIAMHDPEKKCWLMKHRIDPPQYPEAVAKPEDTVLCE